MTNKKNVDGAELLAAIERIAISEKDALVASMRPMSSRERDMTNRCTS